MPCFRSSLTHYDYTRDSLRFTPFQDIIPADVVCRRPLPHRVPRHTTTRPAEARFTHTFSGNTLPHPLTWRRMSHQSVTVTRSAPASKSWTNLYCVRRIHLSRSLHVSCDDANCVLCRLCTQLGGKPSLVPLLPSSTCPPHGFIELSRAFSSLTQLRYNAPPLSPCDGETLHCRSEKWQYRTRIVPYTDTKFVALKPRCEIRKILQAIESYGRIRMVSHKCRTAIFLAGFCDFSLPEAPIPFGK